MDEDNATFIIGLLLAVLLFGLFMGSNLTDNKWRQESIKNGHAQWITGPNGEAMWEWKAIK